MVIEPLNQSHSKGEKKVSEAPKSRDLWHPAVVLRRMGSDADLLCSMVDYFLEDSPSLLRDLKKRIEAGDAAEACRVAHSLKGLCLNFDAEAATQVGALLESACIAKKLDEASELISPLTEELRQLSIALTDWRELNSPQDV